jgi:hypothetical protein
MHQIVLLGVFLFEPSSPNEWSPGPSLRASRNSIGGTQALSTAGHAIAKSGMREAPGQPAKRAANESKMMASIVCMEQLSYGELHLCGTVDD